MTRRPKHGIASDSKRAIERIDDTNDTHFIIEMTDNAIIGEHTHQRREIAKSGWQARTTIETDEQGRITEATTEASEGDGRWMMEITHRPAPADATQSAEPATEG